MDPEKKDIDNKEMDIDDENEKKKIDDKEMDIEITTTLNNMRITGKRRRDEDEEEDDEDDETRMPLSKETPLSKIEKRLQEIQTQIKETEEEITKAQKDIEDSIEAIKKDEIAKEKIEKEQGKESYEYEEKQDCIDHLNITDEEEIARILRGELEDLEEELESIKYDYFY